MPRFSSSTGRQALVTLKQKKKSLADAVNEQLTASAMGGAGGSYGQDYGDGGVAEDFDFDNSDGGSNDGEDDLHAAYANGAGKAGRAGAVAASAKTKKNGKKGGVASSSSSSSPSSSSRLRHRGPLDASLSEGRYAATPVAVESAMDDIFGALDMGDMDAEGEEFFDGEDMEDVEGSAMEDAESDVESDEEASGKKKRTKAKSAASEAPTRKRRRAKDLTEDEYTAWVEQKKKKEKKSGLLRRPLSFGGDGVNETAMSSEEADILRQLNELRQAQHVTLVPSADAAGDSSAGTAASSAASAAAAAQSDAKGTRDLVQHFIMVYGQLLRLRVLLQPAVTRAISVPQYYARSLFIEKSAAIAKAAMAEAANPEEGRHALEELEEQREAAAEKYEELQEGIEEVLSILFAAAVGDSIKGEEHDEGDAHDGSADRPARQRAKLEVPTYRAIERYHERVLRHADNCLDYWGSKLVQANSAKLKTIAQPLPQQIAAILTARSRLRTKVQKNRSHLSILAHPEHVRASTSAEAKAQRALHLAEGDIDVEVYDDADFLRELVRRGGAVANQLEQKVKDMQQALLPSREGARKGFHRMTKGKAVNYEPRPKLVGFMMAESLEDTQRNDVVVKSLFQ